MKRICVLTMVLALVLSASVFAKARHDLTLGNDIVAEGNLVTVPVVITNEDGLMGIDITLKYSEGATLKDVSFEDTRVSYFDLKIPMILEEENIVVIGLMKQMSPEYKPDLSAGTGPVAYLTFEVDDLSEVVIEGTQIPTPHHRNMLIYHHMRDGMVQQETVDLTLDAIAVPVASGSLSGDDNLPTDFALSQNYPNPFNPTTEISFDLPVATEVQLTIFNVLGQRVTNLVDGYREAGSHIVQWDGTNDNGSIVSSGIYFYRLSAGQFSDTRKMMMLK